MLYGIFLHQLFQEAMVQHALSDEFLESRMARIIASNIDGLFCVLCALSFLPQTHVHAMIPAIPLTTRPRFLVCIVWCSFLCRLTENEVAEQMRSYFPTLHQWHAQFRRGQVHSRTHTCGFVSSS